MAFCTNCGKELAEEARFCSECGKETTVTSEFAGNNEQSSNNDSQNTYTNKNNDKFKEYTKFEDRTSEFDPIDISNNKIYAVLSYLGLLVLVPIIAAPKSKFARFHANQGLVLFIIEIAYGIARGIILAVLKTAFGISSIFANPILSVIYSVISTVTGLISVVFLIFAVIGIIFAASDQAKELPIISKFNILK